MLFLFSSVGHAIQSSDGGNEGFSILLHPHISQIDLYFFAFVCIYTFLQML